MIAPRTSAAPALELLLTGPLIPLLGGFLIGRADCGHSPRTLARLALLSLGGLVLSILLPGMPLHFALDVGPMRTIVWAIAASGTCGLGILQAAWKRRRQRARVVG